MTRAPVAHSVLVVAVGVLIALAGGSGGVGFGSISVFMVCALWAFAFNWAAFVPSFIARTEQFYDLTGSLTYFSVVVIAFALVDDLDTRAVLLGAMVLIWAGRLGAFLYRRIRTAGRDVRFDRIKHDWPLFLRAWTIQALWVIFTVAAALSAITSSERESFGVVGAIGSAIWLVGFGIEVTADSQKSAFRRNPANADRFIDTGLWSLSRHPNYVGEIVLWAGIAVVALPALSGWQFVTLLSPLFVYLLLTRVSGVPMLEKRADEMWGGDRDYEEYKASTPVLFPRVGSLVRVGSAAE